MDKKGLNNIDWTQIRENLEKLLSRKEILIIPQEHTFEQNKQLYDDSDYYRQREEDRRAEITATLRARYGPDFEPDFSTNSTIGRWKEKEIKERRRRWVGSKYIYEEMT
jgi:hypothetical protein